MCGISGLWHYHDGGGRLLETEAIRRSTNSLRHRGPDDEGYVLLNTRTQQIAQAGGRDTYPNLDLPPLESFDTQEFDLALGFRRLSILDLSPAGHQPMKSADGKCWIVFNGEIYNYVELRDELARERFEFRTGTDTEVILTAYQRWGIDCLSHFEGMWSFAIWDGTKRQLFLARDRFGIKPLYYVNDGERFIFASEIKALLQHTHVGRRVNPQRLYEYLLSGLTDHGEETLFAGIKQVPAAHSLTLHIDRPQDARPERYWKVDLTRQLNISIEDAAEELRELFLRSVKMHLRCDVKAASILSGGIDSSAIVTCMRSINPHSELSVFGYTADDPLLNEERWIDLVGSTVKADVNKIRVAPEQLIAEMDGFVESQDEPFDSTSIYAQYCVLRRAHESGFKVLLSGQGADEILAGYPSYVTTQMASFLRSGRLGSAFQLLTGISGRPEIAKSALLRSAGRQLLPSSVGTIAKRMIGAETAYEPGWLDMGWFSRREVNFTFAKQPGYSLKEQLHHMLVESNLPMLLRHEDRLAMAHSIESRVPFLTASLVQFLLSLPEKYLISSAGTSKYVFRRAMRGIVPDDVLNRQDKIGFDTPEQQWLTKSQSWVSEVLRSEAGRSIPALNSKAMAQYWGEVVSGRRVYQNKVWRWLNMIRWADKLQIEF
ncbi:MAG: hypothetical protein QOJ64_4094 [Acidobacteriota bacterium]|jgi:asparagine synthase (glutamine-hydrolysing)|nr:hypothetical protein [Acidobacteriota bacterium]